MNLTQSHTEYEMPSQVPQVKPLVSQPATRVSICSRACSRVTHILLVPSLYKIASSTTSRQQRQGPSLAPSPTSLGGCSLSSSLAHGLRPCLKQRSPGPLLRHQQQWHSPCMPSHPKQCSRSFSLCTSSHR